MATNLSFKYVENLKAPGRYTDALVKGLHLWIKANQNKYWIFRFSSNGKQHNISLGAYPKVSIAEARIKAQKARDELDKGSNPLTQREKEVCSLLVSGLLNKEIATKLGTVDATIKVHKARIMEKMHADSLQSLVRMYLEADLDNA